MGQIKVEKNVGGIAGLCVIEPAVHGDARGYFMETYNEKDMKEAGIDIHFVQDNQSMSTKGVLRGLHFQKQYPQCKLVRAVRGTVFDVAVDLRSNSETYTLQGNRWNTWMKNIRNFRDKKYGWGENGSIVGVDLQGTAMEKQIAPETISYYHYFFDGEISRDCCYQCPYAQRQRVGDITVGDYWGVQKYDPQLLVEQRGTINSKEGVSCLLINTECGQHLVEKYGAKIESYPVEFSNIAQENTQLNRPTKHTRLRNKIFRKYKASGYAGVEAIFERGQRNQKFIWGMYDRICGMFCRKTR